MGAKQMTIDRDELYSLIKEAVRDCRKITFTFDISL